ncbi:MAG: SH3 domain-containing protein [Candidatus Omnitrophica bacterium]|nr:SH3 domain-containing protein [Candidatus Omnitrophota bacterium]
MFKFEISISKKRIYLFVFFFLVLSPQYVFASEKLNYIAPAVIPSTHQDMQRPGFWISKHPSADAVILTASEVGSFNQELIKAGLIKDLFNIDAFDLHRSNGQIQSQLKKFERGDYFDRNGKPATREFFRQIKNNINHEENQDIVLRFAFVLRQSDQRLLPTTDILTAEPFDIEFDQVQNSSLDVGEGLVVFAETLDGKWVYTQTVASAGWMKKDNLEFVSSDEFKIMTSSEKFAVVTSAKADLYRDFARTKFYDTVRMGARFPINNLTADSVEIFIAPARRVFISRRDINIGFLHYSPRVIMEQAFKMLNAPYGWGGVHGEQDCSAFLKQIFATVGINMPRNSGEQGQVGKLLGSQGQIKLLESAKPGITIAQLKGHIVLYLGMVDGRPYAIHEVYAYRENVDGKDRPRILNRVVVSDFDLGKGSKKGSLLERIVSIREIR